MVSNLIALSIRNRFLVLTAALFLIFASVWALKNTPVDALPDLSPPQVIVQIKYNGQSPEIVEAVPRPRAKPLIPAAFTNSRRVKLLLSLFIFYRLLYIKLYS